MEWIFGMLKCSRMPVEMKISLLALKFLESGFELTKGRRRMGLILGQISEFEESSRRAYGLRLG